MNAWLYNELKRIAKNKDLVVYSDISPHLGLNMDNESDRDKMSKLLGEIAVYEHENGRPILPAIVVHKGGDNNPGEGFYAIAKELGLYDGSRENIKRVIFWSNQVTLVHNYWSQEL